MFEANSRLFPGGHNQFKRFSSILKQLLQIKEGQLFELGIESNNIVMHSIGRRGLQLILVTAKGDLHQVRSISVSGGWSMGRVKDIYVQYEQGEDMFMGRFLCGLPLLLAQFSSSPPMFLKSETYGTGVTSQWINETKALVFQ